MINRFNNFSVSHGAYPEPSVKWLWGPRTGALQGFLVLPLGSAVLCRAWSAQTHWSNSLPAVRTLSGWLDGVVIEYISYTGSFSQVQFEHVEQTMCPYHICIVMCLHFDSKPFISLKLCPSVCAYVWEYPFSRAIPVSHVTVLWRSTWHTVSSHK